MNEPTTTTESGFAVIDLETTGLAPSKGARIIEVGMVLLDQTGALEVEWETLVDPGCGAGPTHIHGVTDAMLDGAPAFADIAGDLAARLQGRTIVAHNATFDVSFLDAEFRASGFAGSAEPLCTMRLARSRGQYPANLAACCARTASSTGVRTARSVTRRRPPSCWCTWKEPDSNRKGPWRFLPGTPSRPGGCICAPPAETGNLSVMPRTRAHR